MKPRLEPARAAAPGTPQAILASIPTNLPALLDDCFDEWQAERVASGSWARRGTRARARHAGARPASGLGSTHSQNIEDFRAYAAEIFSEARCRLNTLELPDRDHVAAELAIDCAEFAVAVEIDRCEQWHFLEGTLHQRIG
ncbi:MAG: hypothetical protein M3463_04160 [Verrucomicrobiota bacterium]|nr:hypothetical protein [Verrucomicrobiota bacterium]